MPKNPHKTLKDCLLDGGVRGNQFVTGDSGKEKVYTVLGMPYEGKLMIKYKNNHASVVDLNLHLGDLKVETDFAEGNFYEVAEGEKDYLVFCDKDNKLINSEGEELDRAKIKKPRLIDDPQNYISYLRNYSREAETRARFMESMLEKKLQGDEDILGLTEDENIRGSSGEEDGLFYAEPAERDEVLEDIAQSDYPESEENEIFLQEEPETPAPTDTMNGYDPSGLRLESPEEEIFLVPEENSQNSDITDMDTSLMGEEIDNDVNLDSFGSGSGLLDLSLQADDTSLGGILDEIYTTENPKKEDSPANPSTPLPDNPTGETAQEPTLEEIDNDVNLDSFGSGSGLLDLSLQADDTSLGGILDEIYTTEDTDRKISPVPENKPKEVPNTQVYRRRKKKGFFKWLFG
jgi:hypothetical protein